MFQSKSATVEERIAPIINATYGTSPMTRDLIFYLVNLVYRDEWDSRGREYGIMRICWDWFSGGTTAASTARKIEEALRA